MIVNDWDDPVPGQSRTEISDRAERALIGALLISNDLPSADSLTPEMFRSKLRGEVLVAMREVGPDFDPLTVAAQLEKKGVPRPGCSWLTALASCLDDTSADLVRQYSRVIREAWIDRRAAARTTAP